MQGNNSFSLCWFGLKNVLFMGVILQNAEKKKLSILQTPLAE